jgi:hypothetical protein
VQLIIRVCSRAGVELTITQIYDSARRLQALTGLSGAVAS